VPSTCDHVSIWRSSDAATWSPCEPLTTLFSDSTSSFSAVRPKDRTILAYFEHSNRWVPDQLVFQMEKPGGGWIKTQGIGGIVSMDGVLAYHPKWGYVLSWTEPPGTQFPTLPEGPFLLRGPNLVSVIKQLSKKGGD